MPRRFAAGILHVDDHVLWMSVSADNHSARPVRRAKDVIRSPDVRHKGPGRPFSRVEHLLEAGVGLEDEIPAPQRQGAREDRVPLLAPPVGGVCHWPEERASPFR